MVYTEDTLYIGNWGGGGLNGLRSRQKEYQGVRGRTGHHVQGGALNRGLFFADPLPSPLGAVSGKISKIR